MSDSNKVSSYFTRAAQSFDSLYSDKKTGPLMRFINSRFRRDIYERYMLSLDHARDRKVTSVLDVGCGSGRYAVGLAGIGVKRIVGIDFSPTMIELAREYTGRIERDDVSFSFVQTDFAAFSTEETFDLVLSMGFFDYIKDPVPILSKMNQLSKNSVIASFPSVSFYRTPLRRVRYMLKQCPVYFFTPKQIESYAHAANFKGCSIKKIKGAGMDYFVTFTR